MAKNKTNKVLLDPDFIKQILKEMDQDVATRFVASALSLKSRNIEKAFDVACQEMHIRNETKKKIAKKRLKKTKGVKITKPFPQPSIGDPINSGTTAKQILDNIAALFEGTDVKVNIIEPNDDDDDEPKDK